MTSSPTGPDRYRIQGPLGAGGQGRTYCGLDSVSGQEVAIKVIRLRGAEGWKPFDLFERECQVLRSLSHAGIPRYLDTFSSANGEEFYLVMELVRGTSLRQMLEDRRPLPEPQLWNVMYQALEILEYLHGLYPPVIHRDIKPANLIQREDGRLVLVDFGGVRLALRPEGGSTVVGTFGYMAPEQLHGQATPATDIYGLGATLAALASGAEADKLPHRGLKVNLDSVLAEGALRQVLSAMLQPDPDERLGTVRAVRRAIGQAQAGQQLTSPHTGRELMAVAGAGEEAGLPVPVDRDDHPLLDLPRPLVLLVRLLGTLGFVGLAILDAIILPVVFVMLASKWSSDAVRLGKLRQRKEGIRRAVTSGRRTLRSLAQGRDPYREADEGRLLPPGAHSPHRPPLPPGPGRRMFGPRGRGRGRPSGRR